MCSQILTEAVGQTAINQIDINRDETVTTEELKNWLDNSGSEGNEEEITDLLAELLAGYDNTSKDETMKEAKSLVSSTKDENGKIDFDMLAELIDELIYDEEYSSKGDLKDGLSLEEAKKFATKEKFATKDSEDEISSKDMYYILYGMYGGENQDVILERLKSDPEIYSKDTDSFNIGKFFEKFADATGNIKSDYLSGSSVFVKGNSISENDFVAYMNANGDNTDDKDKKNKKELDNLLKLFQEIDPSIDVENMSQEDKDKIYSYMETNNLFGNPEELFDYINQDKDDKFVKHGVNKFIENAFKSSDVWEGVQSTSDNLEADVRNNFGIQGEYDIPTVNGDENIDNAREAYYELIHRMGTDGTNFKAGAEFLESLTPEQKEQIFEYMSEIYEDGESRVPLEAMNKLLDEMKDPQAVIDGLSDETRGKLNVAYMGEEGNPFARNYGDGNITNNNDGIGFGELGLSEEQMNAMFDILYDVDRSDPQYARDTIIESADEFIEVLIALMTDYGKTENPEEYNYEKAADMLATLDIKQIQEVLDAVKDSKYGLQFGDMNLMMVFDQLLDNPKLKENFEAA